MRFVERATEEEMVATFLRTELRSARFRERLAEILDQQGCPHDLIESPDLGSPDENRRRAEVLGAWRGYRRGEDVFRYYPDDVVWARYALTPDELCRVRFMDYSYWNVLSSGTRLPTAAAENVRAGIVVYGQSTACYLALAEELRQGTRFPELILVGLAPGEDLVVLEGHVRLTAYALAADGLPREFTALVGYSPNMGRTLGGMRDEG